MTAAAKIYHELTSRGVKFNSTADLLKVDGNITDREVALLRGNKVELLNIFYGLSDIKKGDLVTNTFSQGLVIDVYPYTNKICFQNIRSTHPNYGLIWQTNPILKIKQLNLQVNIPHNQNDWSNILTKALRLVSEYKLSFILSESNQQLKRIEMMQNYLNCDWSQMSAWTFCRLLKNYLLTHLSTKAI